MLKKDHKIRST